ncbi:MAG TPA: hypothetical protein DCP71_12335 [Verrucomicrobiales bacterium]|nr:hypothetical protein [Verrucomicrobiales bacterium]
MRIRILSDLHQEFGATEIPREDCDLILLAGDIATKQNALPWIREFTGDIRPHMSAATTSFMATSCPE